LGPSVVNQGDGPKVVATSGNLAPSIRVTGSPTVLSPAAFRRRAVMTLLNPARLPAQACTSQPWPSSSQNGAGSMAPLLSSTSTGALQGPAGSVAVTRKIPKSGSG
jgi:hypothetical protein